MLMVCASMHLHPVVHGCGEAHAVKATLRRIGGVLLLKAGTAGTPNAGAGDGTDLRAYQRRASYVGAQDDRIDESVALSHGRAYDTVPELPSSAGDASPGAGRVPVSIRRLSSLQLTEDGESIRIGSVKR